MPDEKKSKENVLIFREKPYRTKEEQELWYRIAIDEAIKQGNTELAEHYQILLNVFLKTKDQPDKLWEAIKKKHEETPDEDSIT